MKSILYPTLDEVIKLHRELINQFGGSPQEIVRTVTTYKQREKNKHLMLN